MDHNLFDEERPESRSAAFSDMEIAKDGWSFEGLLSVYGAEADLGTHIENFARGAYRKVLANGDNVPMAYHHNDMLPVLATTRGGTLVLKDDAKGLRVKADIAQHYAGEATRELLRRGDIQGMSPGFIAGRGNSKMEQRNGRLYRTITGLKKLLDVSLTWDPAYTTTTAELRSLRLAQNTDALTALKDAMQDETRGEALLKALAEFLSADMGSQITDLSQSTGGGSHQQPEVEAANEDTDVDADVVQQDREAPASVEPVQEEQRSGVDSDHEAESAARMRRLQMLGLSLPR